MLRYLHHFHIQLNARSGVRCFEGIFKVNLQNADIITNHIANISANTASSDNDFDFTVNGDLWNKVLEAIRNENEDELKSSLQEVDEDIKKRG